MSCRKIPGLLWENKGKAPRDPGQSVSVYCEDAAARLATVFPMRWDADDIRYKRTAAFAPGRIG